MQRKENLARGLKKTFILSAHNSRVAQTHASNKGSQKLSVLPLGKKKKTRVGCIFLSLPSLQGRSLSNTCCTGTQTCYVNSIVTAVEETRAAPLVIRMKGEGVQWFVPAARGRVWCRHLWRTLCTVWRNCFVTNKDVWGGSRKAAQISLMTKEPDARPRPRVTPKLSVLMSSFCRTDEREMTMSRFIARKKVEQ